jgi:hypothetical protein
MVVQQMKKSGGFALRLILATVSMLSQEDWTETIKQAKVVLYIPLTSIFFVCHIHSLYSFPSMQEQAKTSLMLP